MNALRRQAQAARAAEEAFLAGHGHEMRWTTTRVWCGIKGAGYDGTCGRCGMTACLFLTTPGGGLSAEYANREGRPCWGGRKCPRARRSRRALAGAR